jgi:hypothetical protein
MIYKYIRYFLELAFVLIVLLAVFGRADNIVINKSQIYQFILTFILLLMSIEERFLSAIHLREKEAIEPTEYNDIMRTMLSVGLFAFLTGSSFILFQPFELTTNNMSVQILLFISMATSIALSFYKMSKR